MKSLRFLLPMLVLSLSFAANASATPAPAVTLPAPIATSSPAPTATDHVVTTTEIQSRIDQSIQNEAADRQAIRDLLARPDVRRVAGSAGLDLQRANDAVGTLSGPELTRLAAQARDANSQLAGGATITMTWTMVIIVVVALVVLIAIL